MGYDGEVRINTKIDNKGIIIGVRDAAKRIGALTDEFKKTSTAIEAQTDKIRKMQKVYEMVSFEAKEGNKQAAKYMEELSGEVKSAQKDLTTLTDKTKNLRDALSHISEKGIFDFSGQAKQAQEDIKAFEDTLQRLNNQLAKEQDPATIKALQYEIAETEQGFQKFKDNISQPVSDIMAIQQVQQEIRNVNDEIQRLTSDISMSQNPIEKMQLFVSLERTQNQVKALQEKLESLKDAEIDISVDGTEEIKASIENIGQAAQTAAKVSTSAFKTIAGMIGGIAKGAGKAAKGILGVAKNILTLGASSRNASGGVNGLFKRLLQLGAAAFVFNVLRKGLRELSDSMRGLLMANQEFASAWNNIRVNMITAFAPLWEVLEPAIVKFMQLLARFTAVLAQFMALIFGKTYTQARASAKALNDQSKALKGVGGAAEKASKQLQGFDQINRLAAESGGGGAGAGGLDFEFEEPPALAPWLEELANKLKTLFTIPDPEYWGDLGGKLADWVIGGLNSIPWGRIQRAAEVFAINLAAFLNKFLANPALWQAIGYTVGEALNTVLIFASTLIKNFQFDKFGRSVAAGINKFFDTFDWGLFGRTISGFALGLLDFLSNAIKRVNWRQLGESIREVLSNIDWSGIAKAVYDVVAGAFSAVYDFFVGLLGKPLVDTLIGSAAAIAAFAGSIMALAGITQIIGVVTQLAGAFATLGLSIGAVFGGSAIIALGVGIATFVSFSDMAPAAAIALDLLAGALVAFGIALMAGFGPIGWIVGAIAGLVVAFASLSKHFGWFDEAVPQIQRFGDEISNSTKNMLDPIIDSADEARDKLRSVFEESKPIVASDALEIAGYFTEMANTAIYELERQKNAALQWAAEAFGKEAADYEARLAVVNKTYDAMIADIERHADSLDAAALRAKANFGAESEEYKKAQSEYEVYADTIEVETAKINVARDDELSKTLENFGEQAAAWEEQKQTISQNYDEQIGTIQAKTDEQREIITRSLAEGEILTEESYNTLLGVVEGGLSDIQNVLVTDADERQSLAETRNEDLINEQKRHAAEMLQEYAKDRDEAIKAAKEKHNELEAEARRMYHNGEITREAYQEMKQSYLADKEEAIGAAKEKYNGMMQETTKGMNNLDKEIDLQSGKIQSKWSQFWNGLWNSVTEFVGKISAKIRGLFDGGSSSSAGSISVGGASGRSLGVSPAAQSFSSEASPAASFSSDTLSSILSPAIGNIAIPKLSRSGIIDTATISMISEKGRTASAAQSQGASSANVSANNDSNTEILSLLRELVTLTRKGQTIEMDGQKVARTITRHQQGVERQYGKSLFSF